MANKIRTSLGTSVVKSKTTFVYPVRKSSRISLKQEQEKLRQEGKIKGSSGNQIQKKRRRMAAIDFSDLQLEDWGMDTPAEHVNLDQGTSEHSIESLIPACFNSQKSVTSDSGKEQQLSFSQMLETPAQNIDWKYDSNNFNGHLTSSNDNRKVYSSSMNGSFDESLYDSSLKNSMMINMLNQHVSHSMMTESNATIATDSDDCEGLMSSTVILSPESIVSGDPMSPSGDVSSSCTDSIYTAPSSPVKQQAVVIPLPDMRIMDLLMKPYPNGIMGQRVPKSESTSQDIFKSNNGLFEFSTQEVHKYSTNEFLDQITSDIQSTDADHFYETMLDLEDIMSLDESDLSFNSSTVTGADGSGTSGQQNSSGILENDDDAASPELELVYQQPMQDSFDLAISSQGQGGLMLYEKPAQSDMTIRQALMASCGPPSSPVPSENSLSSFSLPSDDSEYLPSKDRVAVTTCVKSKRGRKRKSDETGVRTSGCKRGRSSSIVNDDEKKRQQNADAAKRYRQKKQQEAEAIFCERDKYEKVLNKTKKKFDELMKKRNLILQLLFESSFGKENHIKYPSWFEAWYKKTKEQENDDDDDDE